MSDLRDGRTIEERLAAVERTLYRLEIVADLRGEDYLTNLILQHVNKAIKENQEKNVSDERADASMRIGHIALAISIIMFLITLITIVSGSGAAGL